MYGTVGLFIFVRLNLIFDGGFAMNKNNFSSPLSLRNVQITDTFWKKEMELVRTEVIPYQWAALNDQVEGAAPSFCMHNFKAAGKLNKEKKELGTAFKEPVYTFRGFEALPEDPKHLDDKFYGFVFQDSDFYKWIEAVGYSLTQHPDPQLEAIADGAIDIVCAAQQEDGYLDTYYILNGKDRIFTNLRDHHELYCLGHLLEGAVAYYQATGKDKLLKAASTMPITSQIISDRRRENARAIRAMKSQKWHWFVFMKRLRIPNI